ncbi:hypothetical protein B0H19DRAFT_1260079 [Mycena capillaripes]|nr:hypothetical protein B0H19DRAFT_1260079 [Mycena capillaripes]
MVFWRSTTTTRQPSSSARCHCSGLENGELALWDPAKNLIASGAVRGDVQYVLAGVSNKGYTVVWNLRGKRKVVALAEAAAELVTASEADQSPIITLWDLKNARAPEKAFCPLSWCAQDADLLLSCGKDNRTLCWNPQTGELPRAQNWAFQVDRCPRNPDLLAAAFFDGAIGLHSPQGTNESAAAATSEVAAHAASGADIFDLQPGGSATGATGMLSLAHPPQVVPSLRLRVVWGFGGKLVGVSCLTFPMRRASTKAGPCTCER